MFSTFSWLEDVIRKSIYLSAWSKLVFYWSVLKFVRDWRVPIAGWQQCPNLLWWQKGKVMLALISETKSQLSLVFPSAMSALAFPCWKARFVILIKQAMLQGLPCQHTAFCPDASMFWKSCESSSSAGRSINVALILRSASESLNFVLC